MVVTKSLNLFLNYRLEIIKTTKTVHQINIIEPNLLFNLL